MKKTCIIPARAGSKRIKNKNLKVLAGKPLVAWTIETALNSGLFDEIILSTDSEEIYEIGQLYGLQKIGLRPRHLAGDYAIAADVIAHYLSETRKQKVCYLQPTSPLRSVEDIVSSFALMDRENAYSVISVCEYDIPSNWIYNSEQRFEKFVENISTKRSQDFTQSYRLNGAVYWFDSQQFLKYKTHLIPKKSVPYVMPLNRSVDIDTLEDFKLAEFYLNGSRL